MGPARRVFRLLAVLPLLTAAIFAQTPDQVGQWSGVMTWPTQNAGWVPTHAMLLTNGKVLYAGSYGDGLTPHIYDPATSSVTTAAQPGFNIFCMGHTHLADGRVFTAGGHIDDYQGYAHATIYNSSNNTWTRTPDMNAGRWYPTNTTLSNGDVLVVSGTIGPGTYNDVPQVYQAGSNSWRTLSSATYHLQLYPFMFLAPNGKVLMAGWSPATKYLDTAGAGAYTQLANSLFGWRNYGAAVMYDAGKVIILGGAGDSSNSPYPTNTAETIDLNSSTPAWKYAAPMKYARRQLNATILPDGKILVTGGTSVGYAGGISTSARGFDEAKGAVYAAEMWDPATNTWTTLASMSKYRGYHSFALLLPDGRVLSAGGQIDAQYNPNGANAEIYSPPYLFKGARPVISSAPTSVAYGQTALIGTASSVAKVTWIRLGAVTHSFNQEQRFLKLNFAAASGGVNVTFPSSANLSPPGYYMLFLLNSTGVPSVAKIIRIGGSAPPPTGAGAIAGKVYNISTNGAVSGATVSYSGGSTTTSTSGAYTLSNVPAGTVQVTARRTGYLDRTVSVNVTSGATTTANIALATAGKIAGKVVTSTGAALSGVTVKVSGGKIATNLTLTTSSTGNYITPWIPVGSYTLTFSRTGYTTQTKSATVNTGTTTTVNATMQ